MFVVDDALDAVLLGSFFFGLVFSAVSLLVGIADLGLGHHGADGGDTGHGGEHGHHLAFLNVGTILAFLTWFGGVGYLVRHALGWFAISSVILGIGAGLAGGYVIAWSLRRLRAGEQVLRAEDYRLPGTIGRITSSIREGGTGEVLFQQGGVRHALAARTVDGTPLPKGAEVVIMREERGIAYVQPWEALVGERPTPPREPADRAASHPPPREA